MFLNWRASNGLLPEYNQLVNGSVMKSYMKKVNKVEVKLSMMATIDLLIIIVIKVHSINLNKSSFLLEERSLINNGDQFGRTPLVRIFE